MCKLTSSVVPSGSLEDLMPDSILVGRSDGGYSNRKRCYGNNIVLTNLHVHALVEVVVGRGEVGQTVVNYN